MEFSQDLIRELQNHLQDVTGLTNIRLKEDDHDASANLRSNAIITMLSLLEMHRTLARSEVASPAVRQYSRSKCGELLSDITLTAQKVIVAHGKYLSNFVVVSVDRSDRIAPAYSHGRSTTQWTTGTHRILRTSFHL